MDVGPDGEPGGAGDDVEAFVVLGVAVLLGPSLCGATVISPIPSRCPVVEPSSRMRMVTAPDSGISPSCGPTIDTRVIVTLLAS